MDKKKLNIVILISLTDLEEQGAGPCKTILRTKNYIYICIKKNIILTKKKYKIVKRDQSSKIHTVYLHLSPQI